jgi:predicted nucleotidyltransferase
MLNEDYKDMLQSLVDENVRFLLVGAYALAAHGYPRATMDIDIWVMPDPENANAVMRALSRFGASLINLSHADLEREGTVFQIGVAPRRIDIITEATGLDFNEAFSRAKEVEIEGIAVRIPSITDLIRNKRATGRTKDIADAEALEELLKTEPGVSGDA